jgi:hypothetical protein
MSAKIIDMHDFLAAKLRPAPLPTQHFVTEARDGKVVITTSVHQITLSPEAARGWAAGLLLLAEQADEAEVQP